MMAPVRVVQSRDEQVRACLSTVMDPELDESVIDLGFVTEVVIGGNDGGGKEDGEVRIGFRLPTYWCAANFAFLMADDMRHAVQALPWVTRVIVHLHDHMYAEAINQGVSQGSGFQASFGDAAAGGLDGLRRTFLLKAFQRRQAALLQHLLDLGMSASTLVELDRDALLMVASDDDGERLVERYLQRRSVVGGGDPAFVNTEGQPLLASALPGYLRDLRRIEVNAEFNGVLCRGLLAVRDLEVQEHPIHIVRSARSMRNGPAAAAPSPLPN